MSEHTFIPPYGGYENLFSYQRARVVYRGTVHFVARRVPRISRTTDQMIQAARSGKQNIVDGSLASSVSKETEIKLTGVALASLGECDGGLRERMRRARLEYRDAAEAIACRRQEARSAAAGRGRGTPGTLGTTGTRAHIARREGASLGSLGSLILARIGLFR